MSRWDDRRQQFDDAFPALLQAITVCSIGDMDGDVRAECLRALSQVRAMFRRGLQDSEDADLRQTVLARMTARERQLFQRST